MESDQAEIVLARMSSYVHEKRTGDREAAAKLLAVQMPGTFADIAPSWKIAEASLFSQQEFKRTERSKAGKGSGKIGAPPQPKGSPKGTPSPKGGKAKGGRGKGQQALVPG